MKIPSFVPILQFALLGTVAHGTTCTVAIATDPVGASVRLDTLPASSAPLSAKLPVGAHVASIAAPGHADTTIAFGCDSGSLQISATLRRLTDSVRSARVDSVARTRREYARRALAQSVDGIPAALEKISAAPGIARDSGTVPTLAVLPFQAAGGAPAGAASSAGETAVLHLAGDRRWKLVERERFQSVLQEQALWGAGAVASDLELGRALEARYLLMGTVTVDGLRRLVAMRLVDAQSGRVVAVGATRVDGPAMDAALEDALGEKFGVSGAVFRSIAVPGWGQFWTDRPVRGTFWLVAAAGIAGTLAWSVADWADKDSKAEDFKNKDASTFRPGEYDEWLARANNAISERNDAATRNLVLGTALAGAWALNVADAAWCGWRSSRAARARYFAIAPVVGPDLAGARLIFALGGAR